MRKLSVVVVLALAAGITSANAEKKQSINKNLAKTICQGRDSCISCYDQQCDHGHSVECPKGKSCSLTTWIVTPPKRLLDSKIPTVYQNKATAAVLKKIEAMSVSPAAKMPGAASKSQMLKSGAQQPPTAMKAATPPSGGLLNQGGAAGMSGANKTKQIGAKGAGSQMPDNTTMQRR
jgi:hypothetical protein